MSALYPLKFAPRFVEKMWGGRKIETILGKALPSGKQIGESWELYDFPPGVVEKSGDWVSSTIANGPHSERSLHWAVAEFADDLLGGVPLAGKHGQFPLLVKFLDAREDLSVQVHPDQAYADAHPDSHLKTEAWYVMEREPGSRLFKGLHRGTRQQFRQAIAAGTVEQHLATVPAEPGQCHYLPSGTIHALGAGILVAEVQTPSDTTFRVHDFNRVDPSTGKTRTLHVEQAMACINFDEASNSPAHSDDDLLNLAGAGVIPLVESPFFVMEKIHHPAGTRRPISGSGPVVLIMLDGEAQIHVNNLKTPVTLNRGDTVLLPAVMDKPVESALRDSTWLRVTFPTRQ